MSLINDALCDLERRERVDTFKADGLVSLPMQGGRRISKIRVVLGGLALFVCGFFFAKFLFDEQSVVAGAADQIVARPLTNMAPGVAELKNVAIEKEVLVDEAASLTSSTAAVLEESNTQQRVQNVALEAKRQQQAELAEPLGENSTNYIDLARLAFQQLRLTTPQQNNAWYFYQQVLLIDKNNQEAIDGIQAIKRRYVDLFQRSWQRGDQQQATVFAERLSHLLDESEVPIYGEQLRQIQSQAAVHNEPEPSVDTPPATLGFTIAKSKQQQSLDLLQRVQQLMDGGDLLASRVLAEQSVDLNIHQAELVGKRLQIYLRQQDWLALEALLKTQSAQGHEHVYYRAKYLQAMQSDAASLAYLQQHQQQLSEVERALLAQLYQQQMSYPEALAQYRLLVGQNAGSAVYWLGRAVNADRLNLPDEALAAYKKSAELGGHNNDVNQFIHERIVVLQPMAGAKELSQW